MAIGTLRETLTTADLLAMPDDGIDRWLIFGELREKMREKPMTVRNRFHSIVMAVLSGELIIWRRTQPEPRGAVLCGEAGVRLSRDPDTTVGIDIAYFSAEVMARQNDDTTLIDGIPLLAVEILSPYDTIDEIHEKTVTYLTLGVPLVWIVNPYERTVTIHRPNTRPTFVNEGQDLVGDPVLPGFRVAVAELFH